jgi:hypothetical protein
MLDMDVRHLSLLPSLVILTPATGTSLYNRLSSTSSWTRCTHQRRTCRMFTRIHSLSSSWSCALAICLTTHTQTTSLIQNATMLLLEQPFVRILSFTIARVQLYKPFSCSITTNISHRVLRLSIDGSCLVSVRGMYARGHR